MCRRIGHRNHSCRPPRSRHAPSPRPLQSFPSPSPQPPRSAQTPSPRPPRPFLSPRLGYRDHSHRRRLSHRDHPQASAAPSACAPRASAATISDCRKFFFATTPRCSPSPARDPRVRKIFFPRSVSRPTSCRRRTVVGAQSREQLDRGRRELALKKFLGLRSTAMRWVARQRVWVRAKPRGRNRNFRHDPRCRSQASADGSTDAASTVSATERERLAICSV
jgi:hypothetical protein